MYYLMNKDKVILAFSSNPKASVSDDNSFSIAKQYGQTPFGFQNITTWIEDRKASKYNACLKNIMKQLRCDNSEEFIRLTHAVGINDTFWISSDSESLSWKDVSPYQNPFNDIISRLAFDGTETENCGNFISLISPELSCDGSFRKCFQKEAADGEFDSNIFLYKRSGELGAGLEPYCEMLASEIAKIVAPSSVKYNICTLHGKPASKCNLFTNETLGYASYFKLNKARICSFMDIWSDFEKIGCEQSFRELLTVDSLCFNQDRHSGNYGVLFDNDTMEILGMSPVFDLNLSMLPYVTMSQFEQIGDKLFEYTPKLGNDFTRIGQIAMNDTIRERLKDMTDFSFSFRGDDLFTEDRIKHMEQIICRQATAILSNEILQTKDVFFSQEAILTEKRKTQAANAISLMNDFYDRMETMNFSSGSFISICESTEAVQLYLENASYLLTLDFLKRKVYLQQNAQFISLQTLRLSAPAFYKNIQAVTAELTAFLKESNCGLFEIDL